MPRIPEDIADFLEPSLRRLVTARLRGARLAERRSTVIEAAVEDLKGVIQESEEFRECLDDWTEIGIRR